jgi:voltage-gated sodium channel
MGIGNPVLPPESFLQILEQLRAAHEREVHYLEGEVSRLKNLTNEQGVPEHHLGEGHGNPTERDRSQYLVAPNARSSMDSSCATSECTESDVYEDDPLPAAMPPDSTMSPAGGGELDMMGVGSTRSMNSRLPSFKLMPSSRAGTLQSQADTTQSQPSLGGVPPAPPVSAAPSVAFMSTPSEEKPLEPSPFHMGKTEPEEEGEENEDKKETPAVPAIRISKRKLDSKLSDAEDQDVGELAPGQHVWQWQRSKGGFRNYPAAQNERIEHAYRNGHSKVRLKSGNKGQTPMEIFFVDMMQLDPKSRNLRKVRRVGAKSWPVELARHAKALARSVIRGEPSWESLEKYKRRQQIILGNAAANVGPAGSVSTSPRALTAASENSVLSKCHLTMSENCCSKIVGSPYFPMISMPIMLLNVIWIGVSVELDEFNLNLYHRNELSVALEWGFMVYFFVELMIQLFSMKHKSLWYRNSWLCVDALCTATIMLEVLVFPFLDMSEVSLPALSILRLMKLARLAKLVREIKDVTIVLRGIASGMRSASVIWGLIAVLLYTYSVLLTTATPDDSELKGKYFGSMGQSASTLITYGIALDGVADFFSDLREQNGLLQGLVFSTFVFVTFFGLLNMLVGAFCNVAIDVASIEEDLGKINYLHHNLENIVECYMVEGSDSINAQTFELIMRNADVLHTLQICGTDLDGLMTLTEILFPYDDSEITFPEFFSVVVRLRKGKPASVSDIIGLQEFTKQKLDTLEEHIMHGVQKSLQMRKSRRKEAGSVFDTHKVRDRFMQQGDEILPEHRKVEAEKVRKQWIATCRGSKDIGPHIGWHVAVPTP